MTEQRTELFEIEDIIKSGSDVEAGGASLEIRLSEARSLRRQIEAELAEVTSSYTIACEKRSKMNESVKAAILKVETTSQQADSLELSCEKQRQNILILKSKLDEEYEVSLAKTALYHQELNNVAFTLSQARSFYTESEILGKIDEVTLRVIALGQELKECSSEVDLAQRNLEAVRHSDTAAEHMWIDRRTQQLIYEMVCEEVSKAKACLSKSDGFSGVEPQMPLPIPGDSTLHDA